MSNIKPVRPYGYFDKALNRQFNTEHAKRDYMKANDMHVDGSMESDERRTNRVTDEINADRVRRGQKPKTKHELVGNSRKIKGPTIYIY
jgi:hypothetical protein